MTALEKQTRMLDVREAADNLKQCIERSVPRCTARKRAIDKVRLARSLSLRTIWQAVGT